MLRRKALCPFLISDSCFSPGSCLFGVLVCSMGALLGGGFIRVGCLRGRVGGVVVRVRSSC